MILLQVVGMCCLAVLLIGIFTAINDKTDSKDITATKGSNNKNKKS